MSLSVAGAIRRLFLSPTLMSWAAMLLRIGCSALVIFLITIKFAPAQTAVFLILLTISNIYWLADLGLGALFARLFGYGLGGASPDDLIEDLKNSTTRGASSGTIRWDTIRITFDQHHVIFIIIACLTLVVAAGVGIWTLQPQIALLRLPMTGWLSLVVVLASSTVQLAGKTYANFLLGVDQLAIQKRYEAVVSTGSAVATILWLFVHPDLLGVSMIYFGIPAIIVPINRWISYRVFDGKLRLEKRSKFRWDILQAMWPQAWRMSVGVVLGQIVFNLASLIVVRNAAALEIATFLFSLRLIRMLDTFSVTPLAVTLPRIARLYYERNMGEFGKLIERTVLYTLPVLVVPGLLLAFFGNWILGLVGSKVQILSPEVWLTLVLGFSVARYGAIHIQIVTVSNRILWHIATAGSGAVFLALLWLLSQRFHPGVAYAVAFLVSNALFYTPYSVFHSYPLLTRSLKLKDAITAGASLGLIAMAMVIFA